MGAPNKVLGVVSEIDAVDMSENVREGDVGKMDVVNGDDYQHTQTQH